MTYYRNWIAGKKVLFRIGPVRFSIRGIFTIAVIITLVAALSVVFYRASHPF
jgi:hypothetical protein